MAAGEAFFFGKGKCGSCHSVSGRGNSASGPDLSNAGRLMTLAELERALRKHDLDPQTDLARIKLALLEGDGSVTICRR